MKKILLIIFIQFLILSAQENQEEKPEKVEPAPLELPNFIIEGVEQINVKSGIKQMPDKTYPLSKKELDSLNSLEKKEQYHLPLEKLPTSVINNNYSPGFVKMHIGRFSDALIEAGYGLNQKGYELFGTAGFNYSSGHVDDANFTDIYTNISSDYIAPDKFFIFGGSRTRTTFNFKNSSYNLYALEDINSDDVIKNNRNATNIGLNVDVDGNWKGVTFTTGAELKTLQINSESEYYKSKNAFDNSIKGYLKVKNMWNNFLVSANTEVDFRSINGEGVNFAQADVSAELFNDIISLIVNSGFQYAVSSENLNRGGFLLSGQIDYRMNKDMTISAGIESGLKKENLSSLYSLNPYMMINSKIDFPYDIMKIKGKYYYQPYENFGFSVSGNLKVTDRFPYFNDSLNGEFNVEYDKVNIGELKLESYWDITETDYLTAYIKTNFASFDIGDKSIPYLPMNEMAINYSTRFYQRFGTIIGFNYVGERYSDYENKIKIDGYFNINLEFNYDILNNLRIFLVADNLTNSEIYVWNGYKERGIFAAIGIMWQF